MKKPLINCLLVTPKVAAVIENYFACQLCKQDVKIALSFGESLFRCTGCGEVYCVTVAECDIIWLRHTAPTTLRQQSAIALWRHDDDTWQRTQPTRRPRPIVKSSLYRINNRDNRGQAYSTLFAAVSREDAAKFAKAVFTLQGQENAQVTEQQFTRLKLYFGGAEPSTKIVRSTEILWTDSVSFEELIETYESEDRKELLYTEVTDDALEIWHLVPGLGGYELMPYRA